MAIYKKWMITFAKVIFHRTGFTEVSNNQIKSTYITSIYL
jgi:hypothetical protein